MAKTVQDTRNTPIEIVDQLDENPEGKRLNIWLLIPIILAVATGVFFVVRNFIGKEE